MPNKARIMVVEDEPEIARFLETALGGQGYAVKVANDGSTALKFCSSHPPDLMILDLGLPDFDGKQVISGLRQWSRLPIIVLSAHDQESEKVAALEAGADDYLTKPFGTAELMARIKVALNRSTRREALSEASYSHDGLFIDLIRRRAARDGNEIRLTPTEYDVLALLARKAGQVVTQTELLHGVWGRNSEENDHYLRIYIQRLRQKLGDDPLRPRYIFTEPGIGYRLAEEKAG